MRIGSRCLAIADRQDSLHTVGDIDRPDPEELRTNLLHRLEEAVTRLLTPGNRQSATLGRECRQHVIIELHSSDRQVSEPIRGKVDTAPAGSISVAQGDPNTVAMCYTLHAAQDSFQNLLQLSRAQQQFVDLTECLESEELLLQAGRSTI